MDSGRGGGANNYRYLRKPPSSDRLLGIFATAHSLSQPSTSTSTSTSPSTSAAGDELSEHDIFDAPSDVSSEAIHHSVPSTSTSPNPNHHRSPNHRSHHKHFGILAALPESESHAPALLSVSSSSSSSSTSSARLIPTIPKRPPSVDRIKYLQSAPVNVPVISAAGSEEDAISTTLTMMRMMTRIIARCYRRRNLLHRGRRRFWHPLCLRELGGS